MWKACAGNMTGLLQPPGGQNRKTDFPHPRTTAANHTAICLPRKVTPADTLVMRNRSHVASATRPILICLLATETTTAIENTAASR